ncbi:MAG: hypothetical protein ABI811_06725 [Acidobacteriota bacterium]
MWFPKAHPHDRCTDQRVEAYKTLFQQDPSHIFPYHQFTRPDDDIRIDVFLYALTYEGRDLVAAVTNGMSDTRMVDPYDPAHFGRREIIQYFAKCKPTDVHRLHGMAYAPHAQGYFLDFQEPTETLQPPGLRRHRQLSLQLDGDAVTLLWHTQRTRADLTYQQADEVEVLHRQR